MSHFPKIIYGSAGPQNRAMEGHAGHCEFVLLTSKCTLTGQRVRHMKASDITPHQAAQHGQAGVLGTLPEPKVGNGWARGEGAMIQISYKPFGALPLAVPVSADVQPVLRVRSSQFSCLQ